MTSCQCLCSSTHTHTCTCTCINSDPLSPCSVMYGSGCRQKVNHQLKDYLRASDCSHLKIDHSLAGQVCLVPRECNDNVGAGLTLQLLHPRLCSHKRVLKAAESKETVQICHAVLHSTYRCIHNHHTVCIH